MEFENFLLDGLLNIEQNRFTMSELLDKINKEIIDQYNKESGSGLKYLSAEEIFYKENPIHGGDDYLLFTISCDGHFHDVEIYYLHTNSDEMYITETILSIEKI